MDIDLTIGYTESARFVFVLEKGFRARPLVMSSEAKEEKND
jgi:hypothetical protein